MLSLLATLDRIMAGIPVLAGGRVQVGVEKTGKTVTVPNDYRAKLMFYMNSKYPCVNQNPIPCMKEYKSHLNSLNF